MYPFCLLFGKGSIKRDIFPSRKPILAYLFFKKKPNLEKKGI